MAVYVCAFEGCGNHAKFYFLAGSEKDKIVCCKKHIPSRPKKLE